jgi:hypothetical protein
MGKQGLSKGVKIHYGNSCLRGGRGKVVSTTANRTLAQIEKERVKHTYEISGGSSPLRRSAEFSLTSNYLVLSWAARQALLIPSDAGGTDGDVDMAGPVEPSADNDDDHWEDEEFFGLTALPPGEEGFLQSHAGGEAILQDIMDGMSHSYVPLPF